MIRSWNSRTWRDVTRNLRLDLLFSAAWTTGIAVACTAAGRVMEHRQWRAARLGGVLAWSEWLAMVLAAIKDVVLVILLRSTVPTSLAGVTRWAAAIEIVLKAAGIGYALLGGGIWWTRIFSPARQRVQWRASSALLGVVKRSSQNA